MTEAVAATQSRAAGGAVGPGTLGIKPSRDHDFLLQGIPRAEDNGAATGLTAQPVGTGHGGGRMTDCQKGKA